MKRKFEADCGAADAKQTEECGIPKEIEQAVEGKNNTTEIVFILDKSGSMAGMESDTVGGFNAMIERQKALDGKAYVSTVLFSDRPQVLHDRRNLNEIEPLTERDYQVGGSTALLDAIGRAIRHIGNIHKYARKEDVPARTMFVITTDGMENASKEYDSRQIKRMIRSNEEKYGWEFLFLAANIDAAEAAEDIGIRRNRAVNYAVEENTAEMYEVLSDTICAFRCDAPVDFENIENDIKKRGSKSK